MKTFTTSFAAIIFALFILTSCGAEEKDTEPKKVEAPATKEETPAATKEEAPATKEEASAE